jgi:hypothetical protein
MAPDPAAVPCQFVSDPSQLPLVQAALAGAERVAIDTEVPIDGPWRGRLRVMSMAVRSTAGAEQAFVIDARDVEPALLGPLLTGVVADGWNATFDARVVDAAVWASPDVTPHLRWWDDPPGARSPPPASPGSPPVRRM